MALKEGETFVAKRSAEKARELLDLAEKAGLPSSVVRSQSDGYIVPTEILGDDGPSEAGDKPAKKKAAAKKASAPSTKKE